MKKEVQTAKSVFIVAVPETAGSALYGMIDVLNATGNIWQTLVREMPEPEAFKVRILSTSKRPFKCGNGIPVHPDAGVRQRPDAEIIVLPELWLGPDEHLGGRYPNILDWVCEQYSKGAYVYSACSGAVMLAETGLLDGCNVTSHWGYADLFKSRFPNVNFQPQPNLVFADSEGRIVTAGGTSSWHDLAIHIISRHHNPGEALRIAKVYLLKWHNEGQLPFAALVKTTIHKDAMVEQCEDWLRNHFQEQNAITKLIAEVKVPERTLKRRFKKATGSTLIDHLQCLRIEEAKKILEQERVPVEEVGYNVGYEDPSFFRRLFKRLTGLTPGQYKRMFRPIVRAAETG